MSSTSSQPVPRWLHAWAIVTVAFAVVLVALGSVVTTIQAGMADRAWPTYPWYLLTSKWDPAQFDFVVEHSHRAAGYVVGCCVIVLVIGLWLTRRRPVVRWLGAAALLCVIAQGVLGGMRVLLDKSTLAAAHGCFAQLIFSLLVALAVLIGSARSDVALEDPYGRRCLRSALALAALAFVQVVWGVILRHFHDPVAQRLHVLTAFAVVAAIVWFVKTAWEQPAGRRAFRRVALVMTSLVVVQLTLGVEVWMGLTSSNLAELQPVTFASALLRTLHVLVGTGVLATSVVAAMQAYRAAAPEPEPVTASTALVAASSHHV